MCGKLISFFSFMQEVPPLDLSELLAYLVRQSGPLFDQLGISRGMNIHVSFLVNQLLVN